MQCQIKHAELFYPVIFGILTAKVNLIVAAFQSNLTLSATQDICLQHPIFPQTKLVATPHPPGLQPTGCVTLTVWAGVMAVADWGGAEIGRPLSAGSITCLVWMPVLFAVVTEVGVASWSVTLELGAACTPCGYYCIATWQQQNQHSYLVYYIHMFMMKIIL